MFKDQIEVKIHQHVYDVVAVFAHSLLTRLARERRVIMFLTDHPTKIIQYINLEIKFND